MHVHKILVVIFFCFLGQGTFAQNTVNAVTVSGKYRKFALYGGVGPSYFINNLVLGKKDVSNFKYAFTLQGMWEPQNSFVSLGLETGYYRLYTVKSTNPKGDISNSTVPIMFVAGMKFSKKFYAYWSMGQSITFNKVSNTDSNYNFNNSVWSVADFAATFQYRLVQKERISYDVELKGFYSSKYENATIALLFIVGFKL
jgi:hypothetical protein